MRSGMPGSPGGPKCSNLPTHYTCVDAMPKTVQLSNKAYQALAACKTANESFSDVVMRLLSERKNPDALLEMSPAWEGYDYDEIHERMRQADLERLSGLISRDAPAPRRKRGRR